MRTRREPKDNDANIIKASRKSRTLLRPKGFLYQSFYLMFGAEPPVQECQHKLKRPNLKLCMRVVFCVCTHRMKSGVTTRPRRDVVLLMSGVFSASADGALRNGIGNQESTIFKNTNKLLATSTTPHDSQRTFESVWGTGPVFPRPIRTFQRSGPELNQYTFVAGIWS